MSKVELPAPAKVAWQLSEKAFSFSCMACALLFKSCWGWWLPVQLHFEIVSWATAATPCLWSGSRNTGALSSGGTLLTRAFLQMCTVRDHGWEISVVAWQFQGLLPCAVPEQH